jgi:hypothetical protein
MIHLKKKNLMIHITNTRVKCFPFVLKMDMFLQCRCMQEMEAVQMCWKFRRLKAHKCRLLPGDLQGNSIEREREFSRSDEEGIIIKFERRNFASHQRAVQNRIATIGMNLKIQSASTLSEFISDSIQGEDVGQWRTLTISLGGAKTD